jgi:hypothetical protein
MNNNEQFRLYSFASEAVQKDIDAVYWLTKGMTDGIQLSAQNGRRDQADWEIIANMAMNKRLLDGNELFIADKIDALKDRATFRWDWYVEKLKAIIEKKKEKRDD